MSSLKFERSISGREAGASDFVRSSIARGKGYFEQLEFQLEINRMQFEEVKSLLNAERLKIYAFLLFIFVVLGVIGFLLVADLSGRFAFAFTEYKTLLNIGAVFAVFGVFELLAKFGSTVDVLGKLSDLARKQQLAIRYAESELSAAEDSTRGMA